MKRLKYKIRHLTNMFSLRAAVSQQDLSAMIERLREIEPDISDQETGEKPYFNDYIEFKRRALQAFQCALMLKALEYCGGKKLTVMDIGDSAGRHMRYLKTLAAGEYDIDSVSVNIDPLAIERIRSRGQRAILSRAEDIDAAGERIDLFTSFQMMEHLHDPATFLRRMAKRSSCNRFVMTVPYLKSSRVGLHHTRDGTNDTFSAEDEHIFELSPSDWTLLLLHSGWRTVYSKTYFQYPKRWPVATPLLERHWRNTDFEGFWGAIMIKDTAVSDRYRDWMK